MVTMQHNQLHLIKRLKRQPRLGMGAVDAFKAASDALNLLFEGYTKGYKDVVRENAFGYLAKQAQDAYDKVNILEERNDKLRQGFNASTAASAKLGYQFDKLAKSIGVNAQKLKDYAVELNTLLPGRAAFIGSLENENKFTGKLAKTTEQYRNKLKIASETVNQFYKNQTLMGKSVTDGFKKSEDAILKIAKQYEGQYAGVYTDLIEGFGSVDAEVAATFGRMPEKLAEAIIKTKKLGIELGTVLAVGDNMLDVESAIAAEIELQVLGATDFNVAAIQKARYEGDALALTAEIEKFVKANGEQFKQNPMLLEKAASALGMQKSEIMDMYAQLQLNEQVTADTKDEEAERIQLNEKLIADYKTANNITGRELTLQERAIALESKQTELEKQQDQAQQDLTAAILEQYKNSAAAYQKQVTDLANQATSYSGDIINASKGLVTSLESSGFAQGVYALGSIATSISEVFKLLKGGTGGGGEGYNTALGDIKSGDDLFIPAGGDNTVVSGPFGSFSLNGKDDILAAPNIRGNIGGGVNANAIASAVASALQGMSFQVTNVFDGDKIASRLQIRKGQTMNNLGNIA